jgi:hypothetical protein
MNPSPASLSDEALAQLILESSATVGKLEPQTTDVFDRVRRFSQLYGSLSAKPEGAALLYHDAKTGEAGCRVVGEKLVVGRLPKSEHNPGGCDLALEDDQLSRRHFEIVLSDGLYILRDLESRNGTHLNDGSERIDEALLKGGDIIIAGRGFFIFTGD